MVRRPLASVMHGGSIFGWREGAKKGSFIRADGGVRKLVREYIWQ